MPPLHMRQIKTMCQCTIHIVITIAPPFICRLVGIVANDTHRWRSLQVDGQRTVATTWLDIIILGGILMYRVIFAAGVAPYRMLRRYALQLHCTIAVFALIYVGIVHIVGDVPFVQDIHEGIRVAMLCQPIVKLVGGEAGSLSNSF